MPFLLIPLLLAQSANPSWCSAPKRPDLAALKQVAVSQPWFDVYEVSPGVFAISEPRQSQHAISYLITGSDKALLFDTGMGIGDLRKVTSELTPKPVTVLNSHTHHDHVGSNWQFPVLGMDTDFTRHNAAGSREEAQGEIKPGQYCAPLPEGFQPETYETRTWKITGYRKDGDKLDLGGRTLEILATPGHTPDAVSLLDRANGLLFTGDTFYPGTIWLYREETDFKAYGASIQRLAALAPQLKLVLGAHGSPIAQPAVLPQLVSAFEAVRAGKVQAEPGSNGRVRYKVGDIGFLMKAAN